MRKLLFFLLIILWLAILLPHLNKKFCRFLPKANSCSQILESKQQNTGSLEEGLALLKNRKDQEALNVFRNILSQEPDNLVALWGEAEVLRRERHYKEAEESLNQILIKNPHQAYSLISMAYIRYKENCLDDALNLILQAKQDSDLTRENSALIFLMQGAINGERAKKGWLWDKIIYGTQVEKNFLKAIELAPDMPKTHLGLGTYYLLAPAVVGGNLDKALSELRLAVEMAPDFATANARLAQAYRKKKDMEKYNRYLNRAKSLDPQNEALRDEKF